MIDELRANVERFGQRVASACLAPMSGDVVLFNVAESASGDNRGMSSSVLPFAAHLQRYPHVRYVSQIELTTSTLDAVVAEHAATRSNLLVLDVQGYELHVLQGAAETLGHTDCIYSEINVDELYGGGALFARSGLFSRRTWVNARGDSHARIPASRRAGRGALVRLG